MINKIIFKKNKLFTKEHFFWVILILFTNFLLAQNDEIKKIELSLSKLTGAQKVNALNKLSELYRGVSLEKAEYLAEEALKISNEEKYDFGKAEALNNLGFIYYRKNELAKAESNYKAALNIFSNIKSDLGKAKTFNYLGLIYWRKNDFLQSFKYYREANKLAINLNAKEIEADALDYMGLIYWKWSQYSKALEYFYNSYRLNEQTGNNFGIGAALNNVSFMYNEMNQPDLAIYYANKILERNISNKYVLGRTYNNLGVSYFKKGDIQKAIEYQEKSLEIKKESGEKGGMAFSYNDLGDIYFKIKNYSTALQNYNLALKLREELNDKYGIASTLISIAKVLKETKSYSKIDSLLTSALNYANQIGNLTLVANVYKELSELNSRKGNNYLAFDYLKKYSELIDSIYNKDSREKIAELTVIYDLDSKENELKIKNLEIETNRVRNTYIFISVILVLIALVVLIFRNKKLKAITKELETKNKEIENKSKELEHAIKTRDKFFSIISHDLRSPFFGIKAMLELLNDPDENFTHDEKNTFIKKLDKAVKDVYNLVDNLIEWAKIQSNRIDFHPENYDLYEDLNSILTILSFNAENKKINIENKINPPIEVFADQNMIHSVLLNLISNAIKFTNENGTIVIFSEDQNDSIKICIKDNGVGIPDEIKDKLFIIEEMTSSRGTKKEKGSGLGLLLCKEMIEKNGGVITFESKLNEGSTFCFTIPKAKY